MDLASIIVFALPSPELLLITAELFVVVAPQQLGLEHDRSSSELYHHSEDFHWLAGLKTVQLSVLEDKHEPLFGAGVGFFLERSMIPEWLELEVSASLIRGVTEDVWIVPLDLLAKKVFVFGPFSPYLAMGPTLSLTLFEQSAHMGMGGVAVIGFYYWIADSVGLDVEVDYALVRELDVVQHELSFALGPTLRF